MKKKTIEKIPYLGLQKISRKKSAKYIGVTAIKIIGHKKHLLLEVYKNKKESKKIPVVRITLTKKDFGTYWPDKNIWTRQQVSYYRPIWMETYTGGILTDENILQSPEDLERIKNFCGTKLFDASWWWEHISRYEADITSTERIKINYRRKRKGLGNIKYIYVLAFDGYVRPHFHILMTGDGMDRDELESLWKKCDRPNTRRISPDDDFLITGLGEYISRNPHGTKRWVSSRNLKKPPEPTKSYSKFKKRRVERMAKDHTVLETELTKEYPGYKFLDAEIKYNGINAAFYIYARMVRN